MSPDHLRNFPGRSRPSAAKLDRRLLLVAAGSFLFCYAGTLSELASVWRRNDMYAHGFLVLPISAGLAWRQRGRIFATGASPDARTGFPVLATGLVMLILGKAGSAVLLQELSLVVTLSGLVLVFLGRSGYRLLRFPVAYLLFMIPFWDIALDRLHHPFQIASASVGVRLLDLFGVPAFRREHVIELPNITLEVARVCSGVNYLVAIVAVGIPVVFTYLGSRARRAAVLALAVLVAVLGNGVRVFAIALTSYRGGLSDPFGIHGPFDIFRALSISAAGFFVLFLGVFLLTDGKGGPKVGGPVMDAAAAPPAPGEQGTPVGTGYRFRILSVLLVVLSGAAVLAFRTVPVPQGEDFSRFPARVGAWTQTETGLSKAPIDFRRLGAADTLVRTFLGPSGRRIAVHVVYFDRQVQGRELVGHKLDPLFADADAVDLGIRRFGLAGVNRRRGEDGELVLFWFDINGRKIRGRLEAKARMIGEALTRRTSNGALIVFSVERAGREDDRDVLRDCREFLQAFYPVLERFLPHGDNG